jgi:tetratricopeptide (TPR) repeat protein
MGQVFAAYDPQLDRKVALKLLSVRRSASSEAAVRLQREAQALARAPHANIVSVYDAGVHDGQVYIAMEYVAGQTLRDWLKERPRPTAELVEVLRKAGEGLAAAHGAGLVHRDFKPANVIVGAGGIVKVLDFGLARLDGTQEHALPPSDSRESARPPDAQLTEAGRISGTPGYLAPEQLYGQPASALGDQFAFGVTLYQAFYGQRPFGGRTFDAYEAALRGPLPESPPTGSAPPRWLVEVTRRCLAKDPAARYPSMRAVLAALANDPVRRWKRRARWLAIGALVLAAGVFGARLARPSCPSEADALAQVWSPERRAAIAAHLEAVSPGREARIPPLLERLERNARRWAAEVPAACRAQTHEPSAVASARVACLQREGQALSIFHEALLQADGMVLAQGALSLLSFAPACSDDAELSRRSADNVAPALQPRARELRARLLRSRAQLAVGRPQTALAEAQLAAAEAADAGLAGFEAEALLSASGALIRTGDKASAERLLDTALSRALVAGVDDVAVEAGSRLVFRMLKRPGHRDEAQRITSMCEALWRRVGSSPRLEFELLLAQSSVAVADGNLDEAVRLDRRRLELALSAFGPGSMEVRSALSVLSSNLWEQGKIAESDAFDRQRFDLDVEVAGPRAPETLRGYANLGMGLRREGRFAEDQALMEHGLALATEVLGADDTTTADIAQQLCSVLVLTDPARALTHCQAALGVYLRRTDPEAVMELWYLDARVLSALGRGDEALAACDAGAASSAQVSDPRQVWARAKAVCHGLAFEALHRTEAARAAWAEASALHPQGTFPDEAAEIAFHLAQALWATPAQRPHARQLAEDALRQYAVFPGYVAQRQQVQAWLVSHP